MASSALPAEIVVRRGPGIRAARSLYNSRLIPEYASRLQPRARHAHGLFVSGALSRLPGPADPLTPEAQTRLATRVCTGDAAAEEELARLFQTRIRLMVLSRVRDAETARDLSQEVLMAVFVALRKGQLREREKLAAFVYGVARNVVNGYFRSRPPECVPLSPDAVSPGADELVRKIHERRIVDRFLESLDATDRRILGLTLREGLKPGEIAERLGLSSEVVRARKSRAIRRALEQVREAPAPLRSTGASDR